MPDTLHLNGTFQVTDWRGTTPESNPLAGKTVDVGAGDLYLIFDPSNGSLDEVDLDALFGGYIRNGYNSGGWDGTPTDSTGVITSSAAAQDPLHSGVTYNGFGTFGFEIYYTKDAGTASGGYTSDLRCQYVLHDPDKVELTR